MSVTIKGMCETISRYNEDWCREGDAHLADELFLLAVDSGNLFPVFEAYWRIGLLGYFADGDAPSDEPPSDPAVGDIWKNMHWLGESAGWRERCPLPSLAGAMPMWMTEHVSAIKRAFRDQLHFTPRAGSNPDDPQFDDVPDGKYSVEINDKPWDILVADGKMNITPGETLLP